MITCWPSLFRPADGITRPDGAIYARVRAPRTHERKDDVPRWSGVEFRDGYRDSAHFVRAWWVTLDFDTGPELASLRAAFDALTGFAHTTWRSTPQHQRWRVGLQLSRAIETLEEAERVWRAIAVRAERYSLEPDFAARSPVHCFALPVRHAGDAYTFAEFQGELVDVDAALEQIPEREPEPTPESRPSDESYSHRLLRAERYLEKMPGAISGSRGHVATFRAACVLVRGFQLDHEDAFRLLARVHNPLCTPEWSERELRHKVRQAFQRSKLPFGAIADRPLDRRTA
jgi:hypothetical protein